MNLKALPLLRLSKGEALARTQLFQRVRDCDVFVGNSAWRITLAPVLTKQLPEQNGLLLVKANWAGAAFFFLLPVSMAHGWIQSRFVEADLPRLPHSYLAMMLESALEDVCRNLQELQRGVARFDTSIECQADEFLAHSAHCPHKFEMRISNDQENGLLHFATDSLGLVLLAGLAAKLPGMPNTLTVDELPLVLHSEIGFSSLNKSEFASLRQGDVVLMSHAFVHPDLSVWLSANERAGLMARWVVSHDGGFLEVTRAFSKADLSYFSTFIPSTMNVTTATDSNSTPAAAVDDISFRVTFDLGDRLMTLGEIKALQIGQPLTLDRPLSHAVNIRVNTTLVGQGELVEIDGRIGVAITTLAGIESAHSVTSDTPHSLDAEDQ